MSYELARQRGIIHAPIERVFDVAIDLEQFAAWFPGVVDIQSLDRLPAGQPGKRYVEVIRGPGSYSTRVVIRLVQAQRPAWFRTEGELAAVLPRMEMRFARIGANSTQVDWQMVSRRRGLRIHLWLPLLRWVMGRRSREGLRRLKSLIEGDDASQSTPR